MQISGARVLLTGATGGIGQAIARALARRDAQLLLSGRRDEVLAELAGELGAQTLPADLALAQDVQRLAEQCGAVDILIANAGLPATGELDSFSVQEIDRALDVNLRAPIVLARLLAPAMRERGRGHIVFMSSLSGKAATAGSSLYNATKFGLRGFSAALRQDLHGTGVGVSAVFPGFISDAGMFAESGTALPPGIGTRTPEAVADAVLEAIEGNRAERDVATVALRASVLFARVAPDMAAAVGRRLGSERIAREMGAGQAHKR